MVKEYGLSRSLRKLGLIFIKCEKCGSGFYQFTSESSRICAPCINGRRMRLR